MEKEVDFILRMPETVGFACSVQNSGTFQKQHFGSKYSTRFQIENLGSKRLVLVLDVEQIVPIRQHWEYSVYSLKNEQCDHLSSEKSCILIRF